MWWMVLDQYYAHAHFSRNYVLYEYKKRKEYVQEPLKINGNLKSALVWWKTKQSDSTNKIRERISLAG